MTDSSPSNLRFSWTWDASAVNWRISMVDMGDGLQAGYDHLAGYYERRLIEEVERLQQDVARYESGRVILTQMIDEYKALVESLKAERDSYKQQAEVNAQTVRDQAMVIRDMRGDDNATY